MGGDADAFGDAALAAVLGRFRAVSPCDALLGALVRGGVGAAAQCGGAPGLSGRFCVAAEQGLHADTEPLARQRDAAVGGGRHQLSAADGAAAATDAAHCGAVERLAPGAAVSGATHAFRDDGRRAAPRLLLRRRVLSPPGDARRGQQGVRHRGGRARRAGRRVAALGSPVRRPRMAHQCGQLLPAVDPVRIASRSRPHSLRVAPAVWQCSGRRGGDGGGGRIDGGRRGQFRALSGGAAAVGVDTLVRLLCGAAGASRASACGAARVGAAGAVSPAGAVLHAAHVSGGAARGRSAAAGVASASGSGADAVGAAAAAQCGRIYQFGGAEPAGRHRRAGADAGPVAAAGGAARERCHRARAEPVPERRREQPRAAHRQHPPGGVAEPRAHRRGARVSEPALRHCARSAAADPLPRHQRDRLEREPVLAGGTQAAPAGGVSAGAATAVHALHHGRAGLFHEDQTAGQSVPAVPAGGGGGSVGAAGAVPPAERVRPVHRAVEAARRRLQHPARAVAGAAGLRATGAGGVFRGHGASGRWRCHRGDRLGGGAVGGTLDGLRQAAQPVGCAERIRALGGAHRAVARDSLASAGLGSAEGAADQGAARGRTAAESVAGVRAAAGEQVARGRNASVRWR
eukprot:ctg_1296.g484